MKKRILGLFLGIVLLGSGLPHTARAAEAELPADGGTGLSISQEGLDLIKRFEGFSPMPIADGTQWSIGYGNACDPADYPYGITEEEAEVLLRESVELFEEEINAFLTRYGVTVTQYQFDALVSITYNLGPSWISGSYRFWSMVRDGLEQYSDNEIASAIGIWCHVGTAVNVSILQRRITEARLFLYGDYTGETSQDFHYVIFDPNGGTVEHDVMLYQEHGMYGEFPEAAREGWYFAGWYTEDGTLLTEETAASESCRVTAAWSETPLEAPEEPQPFTDLESDEWYYSFVTSLAAEGIISGFRDGSYRPDQPVTAGQVLKLVLLACGYPEQPQTTSHWASGYLTLAEELGILEAGQVTNLDAPITRLLVAQITCSVLALPHTETASVYSDTDDRCAMALYEAGIMEGHVNGQGVRVFRPETSLSRAEIAKIVWTIGTY